jgi:PAS domain-containing protein
MADSAAVMLWVTGPDKLCTYVNRAWLEFTGRTFDQELGNGWVSVHQEISNTASTPTCAHSTHAS